MYLNYKTVLFSALAFSFVNLKTQAQTHSNLLFDSSSVSNPLNIIQRFNPVPYHYQKDSTSQQSGLVGFNLQEVKSVCPEIIHQERKLIPTGKNNYRTTIVETIDMEKLIPVLVGALQQQQREIKYMKEEIEKLHTSSAK